MTPTITPYTDKALELRRLATELRTARAYMRSLAQECGRSMARVEDARLRILAILDGLGETEVIIDEVLIAVDARDEDPRDVRVSEPLVLA